MTNGVSRSYLPAMLAQQAGLPAMLAQQAGLSSRARRVGRLARGVGTAGQRFTCLASRKGGLDGPDGRVGNYPTLRCDFYPSKKSRQPLVPEELFTVFQQRPFFPRVVPLKKADFIFLSKSCFENEV